MDGFAMVMQSHDWYSNDREHLRILLGRVWFHSVTISYDSYTVNRKKHQNVFDIQSTKPDRL